MIAKPIVIEKNVWIAAGRNHHRRRDGGGKSLLLRRAPSSTKDVPPNTLVGGNPANVDSLDR